MNAPNKIVVTWVNRRQTPPGEPIDPQRTIEAAQAVTGAASAVLAELARWYSWRWPSRVIGCQST